jgi:DNA-binding NarL/FixJ family response regulator
MAELLDAPIATVVRLPLRPCAAIRVLLVGGPALVRAGLRSLLEQQPGVVVVGEADSAGDAVALVRSTRPEVILVDVGAPGLDPVESTRLIAGEPTTAGAAIVLLTESERDGRLFAARRRGATRVLVKHSPPAELIRAVRVLGTRNRAGMKGRTPWSYDT